MTTNKDHIYRFRIKGSISPMEFNSFLQKRTTDVIIEQAREVDLPVANLVLLDNQPDLPLGDTLVITLGSHFTGELKSSVLKREEEYKIAQELEREQLRLRREEEAAEALRFNESLSIPVLWTPDIKIVMSGLQLHSNGSGFKKNTVYHVKLLEDLNDGRLKRQRGEFLCSKEKGALDYINVDDNHLIEKKVTCKACLKVALRFK